MTLLICISYLGSDQRSLAKASSNAAILHLLAAAAEAKHGSYCQRQMTCQGLAEQQMSARTRWLESFRRPGGFQFPQQRWVAAAVTHPP